MAVYNRAAQVASSDVAARPNGARTRTDDVFRALRLAVVQGEIRPGERLTEEGIAGRFSVSRTPVREALRRLEQEGLIQHLSFGGYTARPIDLREATDLYEARVALEDVSVDRATRNLDRAALEPLLALWSNPASSATQELDVVYADEEFHETLALAGGNQPLHSMLQGINARLHALRVKDFTAQLRIDATFQQHSSILQAVLSGDARLAAALMRAHILESQAHVEQLTRAVESDER